MQTWQQSFVLAATIEAIETDTKTLVENFTMTRAAYVKKVETSFEVDLRFLVFEYGM